VNADQAQSDVATALAATLAGIIGDSTTAEQTAEAEQLNEEVYTTFIRTVVPAAGSVTKSKPAKVSTDSPAPATSDHGQTCICQ
jgi:hypothetical protein